MSPYCTFGPRISQFVASRHPCRRLSIMLIRIISLNPFFRGLVPCRCCLSLSRSTLQCLRTLIGKRGRFRFLRAVIIYLTEDRGERDASRLRGEDQGSL